VFIIRMCSAAAPSWCCAIAGIDWLAVIAVLALINVRRSIEPLDVV